MGNRRERYETDRLKRDLQKMKTRQFLREIWSNKKARVGTVIIVIFALMAIFGPLIMPFKTTDIASSETWYSMHHRRSTGWAPIIWEEMCSPTW